MKEFDKKLFDEAIKVLTKEYEYALNNPKVSNPLSYALYNTWRRFDMSITKTKKEIE